MNDPKDPKNLPPDDFSKTTPYIRTPRENFPTASPSSRDDYASDWEKTNFNFSIPRTTPTDPGSAAAPPAADDWGKTAVNINLPQNNSPADDDYGKTFLPGQMPAAPRQSSPQQQPSPSSPDWGVTQANINLGGVHEDFGASPRAGAQQNDFHATTPFIQLPEAERAKYQNQPQTTPHYQTAAAEEEKKNERKPTPAWVWFAGVAGLFFLIATVMIGAYLVFRPSYGFDVMVKGAQPNSDVFVDGTRWGYTSADGSVHLSGLGAGTHKIEIKHPQFTYEIEQVTGDDGDKTKEVVAKSRPNAAKQAPPAAAPDDCQNLKKGEFEKSAKCANDALDRLGENFSVQDLLNAMNLYIINFDVNKFNVKPNDMKFLEKASGYMKRLPPNVKIEVGGHTDSDGNDASNQKLSENRANAVKNALVQLGVKQEVLEMRGYGETRPKPGNTNASDDEKFQNRRIEYTAIIR